VFYQRDIHHLVSEKHRETREQIGQG
jgi:hypothetical protein